MLRSLDASKFNIVKPNSSRFAHFRGSFRIYATSIRTRQTCTRRTCWSFSVAATSTARATTELREEVAVVVAAGAAETDAALLVRRQTTGIEGFAGAAFAECSTVVLFVFARSIGTVKKRERERGRKNQTRDEKERKKKSENGKEESGEFVVSKIESRASKGRKRNFAFPSRSLFRSSRFSVSPPASCDITSRK